MHANNEELVKIFALHMPVSRVLVNTPSTLGGIGASTNLTPALTLGCGAIGGSSTSNNIGPLDLINIKKVAYGVKEMEEIRGYRPQNTNANISLGDNEDLINILVKRIIEELR